jgi:hypothetical protein
VRSSKVGCGGAPQCLARPGRQGKACYGLAGRGRRGKAGTCLAVSGVMRHGRKGEEGSNEDC